MNRSPWILGAAVLAAACASPGGLPAGGSEVPAVATEAEDPAAEAGDKERDGPEESTARLERELERKRLDVSLAEAEAEETLKAAGHEVHTAQVAAQEAERELAHFVTVEGPLQLESTHLQFDRAKWSREENRQELDELEKMYQAEDLAELTKELVLQRGKMQLLFSERELKRREQELVQLKEYELPRKQRELELKLHKATEALRAARVKSDLAERKAQRSVLAAEHEVADALEKLDKARKKAAPPADS